MFRFTTTQGDTRLPVNIDGDDYLVPRFTMPDLEIWGDRLENAHLNEALALIKDDEKRAKVKMFWQVIPMDLAELDERSRTPAGIKYILEYCLQKAGVPDATVDRVMVQTKWADLQNLCGQLVSVSNGVQTLKAMTGGDDGTDPLPSRKRNSGGNRSPGKTTPPASKRSTKSKSPSSPSTST